MKPRRERQVICDGSKLKRRAVSRILVADPDPLRRAAVSPNQHGVEVFRAANLSEAFDLSEAERPDAVAIAVELTREVGFKMFLHLIDTLSIAVVTYGTRSDDRTHGSLWDAIPFVAMAPGDPPGHLVQSIQNFNSSEAWTGARSTANPIAAGPEDTTPRLIVMGSSTGGVGALEIILRDFPFDCPPTVIVQHIAPGFADGMIDRLDQRCAPRLMPATDGAALKTGHIYVAHEAERHLIIEAGAPPRCRLQAGPTRHGHKPSIDVLFESAARLPHVAAALLTGMGSDGADGLRLIRRGGGITIAQNAETSVVFGMPRAAVERGAATHVLPVGAIARALLTGDAFIRDPAHKPRAFAG